ncbi:non-ribosomal peptide synthetase [Pseudoalteromonas luteoviolacea]|uniref:non-ribosomal peptide synthetase n=1 Tax=Pseudoalteromonas luteoviolacea TaxID=43657 RepID=UPI001D051BEC|nr:non-ribosomal peptide synthetase [Pseudoalteromonas luteoviolacea]
METQLVSIWQSVLELEKIGTNDNFFSIGGDSILSLNIVSALKDAGINISVKHIFEHQTVKSLAEFIVEHADQGASELSFARRQSALLEELAPYSQLTEEERSVVGDVYEDAYPMSSLQEGMVFHTQLSDFSGIYHDIMAEHVVCEWNQDAFRQALDSVVEQHPILRTNFLLNGERAIQVVQREKQAPLEVIDIRDLDEKSQDLHLETWMEQHKKYVFDWENGPLFQIHIFLRSDESFEFVVSFHHAILDGWSKAALSAELYEKYQAVLAGDLPENSGTDWVYRNYVALEQDTINDPEVGKYFANQLENAHTDQLSAYKLKPAVTSKERNQGFLHFEALTPLSSQIIELSKSLGVSVQSIMFTAHLKVISILGGHNKATSCITTNGRPEITGSENALGLYLNSLPLSLDMVSGSWQNLIEFVSSQITENIEYRRYPLARIQQDLDLDFSEITFNYTHFHVYKNMLQNEEQQDSLEVLASTAFEQTNFDFHVDVSRDPELDEINVFFKYNAELFDSVWIEKVSQYYLQVLELIVSDLESSHQNATILNTVEAAVFNEVNSTDRVYDAQTSYQSIFEQQVELTPNMPAVQCGDLSLSYAQLNERANRLAAYLEEMGMTSGERVGICLDRSISLVVAILGVMKSGATYVALEPSLPQERLDFMVEDADIPLVLLDTPVMEKTAFSGVDIFSMDGVDGDERWLDDYEGVDVNVTISNDDILYILYTSGSTGNPKGVLVPQKGVLNYLSHASDVYFNEDTIGAVVSSPLCFDATVTSLLTPLVVGKVVKLIPESSETLPLLAEHLFGKFAEQAWVFKITPAHLEALAYLGQKDQVCSQPHVVVVGGDQLTWQVLKPYKEGLLPNTTFVNEYGPTETVVGCSICTVLPSDAVQEEVAVPIGKPIQNTQLFVLSDDANYLPIGGIGELYIGGDGVTSGYLNQESKTRDSFVTVPDIAAGILYRTGDLVRWREDGELEFVGRVDHQVKIRGYRIELGEIESKLLGLSSVREAVSLVRQDSQSEANKQLVAYVVPEQALFEAEPQKLAADKLALAAQCTNELKSQLPEYMVPSSVIVLEAMPLSTNGKVDRKALMLVTEEQSVEKYIAPRNAIEKTLCSVWQQILKVDKISVRDSFFSIGGDSILSIRIVALLKEKGIQISMQDLFNLQTIEALAENISTGEQGIAEEINIAAFDLLEPEERALFSNEFEDAYPMSTLQTGMVFHTQLEGFNGIYHDINAEHVKCEWDESLFGQALQLCIDRHPILRTGFRLNGSRPIQQVYKNIQLPLVVEDIKQHPSEKQNEIIKDWMAQRQKYVFDWSNGPLYQINVFLRSEDEFEFIISFHHSVLDGWSRASFSLELYQYYERLLAGESIASPEADWTYRYYIAAELDAKADDSAKAYFKEQLSDIPVSQLPRLNESSIEQSNHDVVSVEDIKELSAEVILLAKSLGVPIQSVLMAAHFKALSMMSGFEKAVTGLTTNGRPEREGGEQGLGLFLNVIPLSMQLKSDSWRELILNTAELMNEGLAHRRYPLLQIQQDVNAEFSEVLFNYTHFHVYEGLNDREQFDALGSSGVEYTNYDFTVDGSRSLDGSELFLFFGYNPAVYERSQIVRFSNYYQCILKAMTSDLDGSSIDSSLFDEETLRLLQLDKQYDYWAKQLDGAPLVHGLPLSNQRLDTKSHVEASIRGSLPAEASQKLQAIAKQYQLTTFMLLHGALSLLIARHSNSSDIVIGTPLANQMQAGLDAPAGIYVNTLALRVSTQHDTLSDYLSHIRHVHLGAQSNQDVPFEQLVERLNIPRSTAHSPLFQIMLSTNLDYGVDNNANLDAMTLSGDTHSHYQSDLNHAKLDLDVNIDISDEGVAINWSYDAGLFDDANVQRLNDHLCRLLTGLSEATSGESALSQLPMLSNAEEHHLIHTLNNTAMDYPKDKCIHELFEQQAQVNPDSIAVVFEDKELTYKELNEKANQLAHYLVEIEKVTPDTLVGLCVERSLEMVIGMLGILKAGGAYVPLDPSYPQQRLEYMIEDASLTTIVSHEQASNVLGAFTGQIINLDDKGVLENYPKINLEKGCIGLTSNHLAYVIYTSGSTGQPKGVMIEHIGLVNTVVHNANVFQITPETVFLQSTSISFDAATWVVHMTLFAQGVLRLADNQNPMATLFQYQDITHIMMTPSMLESVELADFSNITHAIVGGEALSERFIASWVEKGVSCYNAYGPTESSICSTIWQLNSQTALSIGRANGNTHLYVLDGQLNLCVHGAEGELYIGGDGLARGYLNLPELTTERFIENPYYDASIPNSSKRLFRTGDLVRYLPDGNLEFMGRVDDQVKIRGFRIELGEVESQLSRQEGVDSALVMAKELAGSQQLVGYVKSSHALAEDAQADFISAIKASIAQQLPDYMVPSVIMLVDEWPLTPNGKVDRSALPATDSRALQGEYVAPETETEKSLVTIWSDLLSIDADQISTTANFFELGGHSLGFVRLQADIKEFFSSDVDMRSLYSRNSIKEQAELIEAHNLIGQTQQDIVSDEEMFEEEF